MRSVEVLPMDAESIREASLRCNSLMISPSLLEREVKDAFVGLR